MRLSTVSCRSLRLPVRDGDLVGALGHEHPGVARAAEGAVGVLDLFEAEGINTLYGIPDPNFVHMFAEADARGWSVVAPHHELSAGFMAEAASRMTGRPSWYFNSTSNCADLPFSCTSV